MASDKGRGPGLIFSEVFIDCLDASLMVVLAFLALSNGLLLLAMLLLRSMLILVWLLDDLLER